jgi:hypothetical protein
LREVGGCAGEEEWSSAGDLRESAASWSVFNRLIVAVGGDETSVSRD